MALSGWKGLLLHDWLSSETLKTSGKVADKNERKSSDFLRSHMN